MSTQFVYFPAQKPQQLKAIMLHVYKKCNVFCKKWYVKEASKINKLIF